ncbi:(2Fe-2S)-binding protein [Oricola indica]|uniref:(2Fe-2S)-binding protein n=1 Tax=Oricola indica TaxID=2872591 RepID=UPI003CCC2BF6
MPRLTADQKHRVHFTLNGRPVSAVAENRMLLTDLIRHELGLTGTHVGCEHGVCGACTVQIDGQPARACLTLTAQVEGADVRTVEALAPAPDRLSALQAAFRRHHGLQCGFCTAGILMSLDALLRDRPEAGSDEIREQLSGHLCRCTGYASIVEAALSAAEEIRKEEVSENV